MLWRKRFGTTVCNSTATSPRRPCVLTTTARVIHSPLAPSAAIRNLLFDALLFDDLQCVALVQFRARCAQHVAKGASHATGAPNDLAQIGLGHFEFNDGFVSVFVLVNKNFAFGLDDRLAYVFNHSAAPGACLDHLHPLNCHV